MTAYRQHWMREGEGGSLSMILSVVETGMFHTIGLFHYVSAHFDADCSVDLHQLSLVWNIYLGGILQPMETLRLIKKMQGMKRHRKQFVKRDIFVGQTPPALPYALLANRPTYPRHLWRCGPKLTRKTSKRNTASVLGASSSSISDHVLYHHQQQVLLFKEEVMKQQKLKLCFLHTKQSGRSSC